MLKKYPKFKRGEVEQIYKKLSKNDKEFLNDYLSWRHARGCGHTKLKDVRRVDLQVSSIIEKPFKEFTELKEHTNLVNLIRDSYFSKDVKKNTLIELNNLFSYALGSLWDIKFKDLYAIKEEKGVGSDLSHKYGSELITDQEVEQMFQIEKNHFWKTFLLVGDVTGLRVIEERCIKNKGITFNEDNTASIEIFMTKTGKTKTVFTDPQTTDYIKRLIEIQKNSNDYGEYLFHSPKKTDIPIHKNAVNKWFKELSLKATGKHHKPYELRHKFATKKYKLMKEGKISEYATLKLIGHSRSMIGRYDSTPKEEEIKILKEQSFKEDISPQRKHELEEKIDRLERKLESIEKKHNEQLKQIYAVVQKNKKIKDKSYV